MGRIKLWIEGLIHSPFSKDAESSSGSSPDIAGDHPPETTPPSTKKQWTLTRYMRHLGLALVFVGKTLLRRHGKPVDEKV